MKKPKRRNPDTDRKSDNYKRRLDPSPDPDALLKLSQIAVYVGISKHKYAPLAFGLEQYTGAKDEDRTMCDRDADFGVQDMTRAQTILRNGIAAGLVGKDNGKRMVWGIDQTGWVFEARITNPTQHIYHGYPVRASEAVAEYVLARFATWCSSHGSERDKAVLKAAQDRYEVK